MTVESVAPTPWGRGGMYPPLLQKAGHGGHREKKNSKQETDQTVLTIAKALTKTTNCAVRAKKWRGTTKKKILSGAPVLPPLSFRTGAPTFKFVPVPLCGVDQSAKLIHFPTYAVQTAVLCGSIQLQETANIPLRRPR